MVYFTPQGSSELAREFEPQRVLASLAAAVEETLRESGVRGGEVSAVGVTSQRQGLVFLDRQGQEMYCGPNLDVRALFEGAAIDDRFADRVYRTTGHFPSLLLAPARLRWLQNSCPRRYAGLGSVLSIAGWVAYRLTGNQVSEASLEAGAGLADVSTGERCTGLMDDLGVPTTLFPPLVAPGQPAGMLRPGAGDSWGLAPGTPVFLAGADTQCGLLGMGLARPGQVGALLGWSGAVQALTPGPRFHQGMGTWAGRSPLQGVWTVESNLGDAGNAYRWLKDTLLGGSATFEDAEALAREAAAAPCGVMALLGAGPVPSMRAGLKQGGLLFPTPLSFHESSRGQLLRAALESVAFSTRANLDTALEVAGFDAGALYLGGGMARSETLAQTVATVLGLPVRKPQVHQVSARGAAILAGWWADPATSLDGALQVAAHDCRETEPGPPGEVARYQEHYREWLDLYQRLELPRN
jgi:autoinducer 2 (AI-2) kinase